MIGKFDNLCDDIMEHIKTTDKLRYENIQSLLEVFNYKTNALTSKMWITPDARVVQLSEFHQDYIKRNISTLSKKYKLSLKGVKLNDETAVRFAAIKSGFFRVNYQYNGGLFTVEGIDKFLTSKIVSTIYALIYKNISGIDNVFIVLMDQKGNVTMQEAIQLFTFEDDDKLKQVKRTLNQISNK